MSFTISGLSFSKAHVLNILGMASLPILADQAVSRVFLRNVSFYLRETSAVLAGAATYFTVTRALTTNSSVRRWAPVMYLAYKAAQYFLSSSPKPAQAPKPSQLKKAEPIHVAKPEEKKEPKNEKPQEAIPARPASEPVPGGSDGIEPIAKPEEKGTQPSIGKPPETAPNGKGEAIKKRLKDADVQQKAFMQAHDRLMKEMRTTATKINVTVKITQGTEELKTNAKMSLNVTRVFRIQEDLLEALNCPAISEKTAFCWVHLANENTNKSLLPFEFLPVEILRSLDKKTTVLMIETKEKKIEVQLVRAGVQDVQKCLKKLDACKNSEWIQPEGYVVPMFDKKKDPDNLTDTVVASMTASRCYLEPFGYGSSLHDCLKASKTERLG